MYQKQDVNSLSAPTTFEELQQRLNGILGKSISELSLQVKMPLPIDTVHGKGFTGEVIEACLGASAQNLPIPDFPYLGLELKIIPLDSNFKALESTFLCHAPLTNIRGLTFENSALYTKIKRVLFVLVNATRDLTFEDRKVLGFFFYTPTQDELQTLKSDFDELYEMVKTGYVDSINARIGQIIQMRPKGADGKALTECIGPEGEIIRTRPRGFYMRRAYTQIIINKHVFAHND